MNKNQKMMNKCANFATIFFVGIVNSYGKKISMKALNKNTLLF